MNEQQLGMAEDDDDVWRRMATDNSSTQVARVAYLIGYRTKLEIAHDSPTTVSDAGLQ